MSLSKKFIELVKEDIKEDFYLQYRGVDLRRSCQIIVRKKLYHCLSSQLNSKKFTPTSSTMKKRKVYAQGFFIIFYETFR